MPRIETVHERLDREHTEATLRDYSADYETWLEDKVEQLEVINADLLKDLITTQVVLALPGNTNITWLTHHINEAIRKAEEQS